MLKLKTLNQEDLNFIPVFVKALKLKGYDYIANTFFSLLEHNEDFSESQKLAIRLTSKEILYMGASEASADAVLMQILNMKWQNLGLNPDNIPALNKEDYELVILAIMSICKGIIYQESQELLYLSQLPTELPENWDEIENLYGYGYGINGYGYGYYDIDFFEVFL